MKTAYRFTTDQMQELLAQQKMVLKEYRLRLSMLNKCLRLVNQTSEQVSHFDKDRAENWSRFARKVIDDEGYDNIPFFEIAIKELSRVYENFGRRIDRENELNSGEKQRITEMLASADATF